MGHKLLVNAAGYQEEGDVPDQSFLRLILVLLGALFHFCLATSRSLKGKIARQSVVIKNP